ncbi:uncharacterized protein LOC125225998 [Leguminivora glycinivorella]|uniref:uncharacterized protein LOC125225998 n=1 Tax=Leguminivora glycinivorella TaxID=1035111 RepID=UPI00201068DB|nr:uncharacterized protein LOC125225998 [Leguminivora glycinivorella]
MGDIIIIGVYFSPNRPLREFEAYLERLGRAVAGVTPSPIIVMGDLNAKCTAWGSPRTDPRGEVLLDWLVGIGLEVVNRGAADTCVRPQGGSIVDITLASPTVSACIANWRVLEDTETLSDHLYIRMRVSRARSQQPIPVRRTGRLPRWSLASLDREAAREAAMVEARWGRQTPEVDNADDMALGFRASLTRTCDASMRRVGPLKRKKATYWWCPEVAALWVTSNAARRQFTRCRRRRHTQEELDTLYVALSEAKKALNLAIAKAKDSAYTAFLASLDENPWGRPYKLVRKKLRRAAPMDAMEMGTLQNILEGLFPAAPDFSPPAMVVPRRRCQ